ncbi:MAG: hypothetical protein R2991_08685 [Thermoanaerobaculia bacterium]
MSAKSQQLQIRIAPAQKAALKRRARRAGLDLSSYVLTRVLPPESERVEALVRALRRDDTARFALAELNTLLAGLTAAQLPDAVADVELTGLSPFLRNYLAAMVEETAQRLGVSPPPWVHGVEPLDEPYFAAPFPRLRPYLLLASPVAFKRRNLYVDAGTGDRV